MSKVLKFPKGFIWGTSTAAAQVETAYDHNWKGVKARDGYTFDRTTDHEKRRKEDAGYIAKFGSVYRCGVDWSRLQEAPFASFDPDVVAEYEAFFMDLKNRGISLMLVVHHFMNPTWFEKNGSWLNPKNIDAFLDYAEKCLLHFGKYASNFNTFNEPNVYAFNGYFAGNFPPFKKNYFKANRVLDTMGQAHDLLYDKMKELFPDIPVGISLNTAYMKAQHWLGKPIAKFSNWWFLKRAARPFEKNDYWGLSYYAFVPFRPFPVTEIDTPGKLDKLGIARDKMWGYYPQGFGVIMKAFTERYKKPIIITENGICSDDPQQRIQAIKDYLSVCHQVMQEGVDLRGYIHWSTWDNFEWNLGPTYRFGLVRVDFDTMERTYTQAATFYEQVTSENQVVI